VNKTEREILYRMHCLFTAIPLPIAGGGTQSASMTGFVAFGQDMAEMRPKLDEVWGYFNFKEYEEAKVLLSAIEAWIEMRKGQNWELQASLFRKEIEHFKKELESPISLADMKDANDAAWERDLAHAYDCYNEGDYYGDE